MRNAIGLCYGIAFLCVAQIQGQPSDDSLALLQLTAETSELVEEDPTHDAEVNAGTDEADKDDGTAKKYGQTECGNNWRNVRRTSAVRRRQMPCLKFSGSSNKETCLTKYDGDTMTVCKWDKETSRCMQGQTTCQDEIARQKEMRHKSKEKRKEGGGSGASKQHRTHSSRDGESVRGNRGRGGRESDSGDDVPGDDGGDDNKAGGHDHRGGSSKKHKTIKPVLEPYTELEPTSPREDVEAPHEREPSNRHNWKRKAMDESEESGDTTPKEHHRREQRNDHANEGRNSNEGNDGRHKGRGGHGERGGGREGGRGNHAHRKFASSESKESS